jgi:hypothetical protein
MVVRYRRGGRAARLRLAWLTYAAVLLVATYVTFMVALATLPPDAPVGVAILIAYALATTFVPIAAAIAILRHRLFDIEAIVSRTLVLGALTAILAGVYAASIRLYNALFVVMAGEESEAALVITTLILAASFTPLKHRLEHAATRRFGVSDRSPGVEASRHTEPGPAPRDAFSDPDFLAALDARILEIARRAGQGDGPATRRRRRAGDG